MAFLSQIRQKINTDIRNKTAPNSINPLIHAAVLDSDGGVGMIQYIDRYQLKYEILADNSQVTVAYTHQLISTPLAGPTYQVTVYVRNNVDWQFSDGKVNVGTIPTTFRPASFIRVRYPIDRQGRADDLLEVSTSGIISVVRHDNLPASVILSCTYLTAFPGVVS